MSLYEIAMQYWQKNVKITTSRGNSYVGRLIGYTPECDNEPDPESIFVSISANVVIELFGHEIENITQVDK